MSSNDKLRRPYYVVKSGARGSNRAMTRGKPEASRKQASEEIDSPLQATKEAALPQHLT